ncbi:DNA translocase FtsK [Pseudoruegeria sp. SK021]|uniref:DNA translocase FtsK n=1 Tax=Pseudoruegeria sp. SK021 TaxID=1933035 RepID=UPI000A23904C|nr:DNA translocase FtsK [Pseudoruegeria sp. SK021]OSP55052.1 cell division protein FtsK [Pseudoruegeria sp. SK021]
MAYQTRRRDPLFDQATQVALEKRARELMGVALFVGATLLALALASYSPTDPSFLGTSSEAPQNWLGYFGAYLAAPLYVILGAGSWALVAVGMVWGVRFAFHLGEDRAFGRLIFVPVFVAVAAVYAATYPPGAEWVHSFGMGGLFGDTALGVLLGILPLAPSFGLLLSAAALAILMLAAGLHALGFTRPELAGMGRFLWFGTLFAFDGLIRKLGHGASRTREQLVERVERRKELRAERRQFDDEMLVDEDDGVMAPSYDRPAATLPPVPKLGGAARTISRDEPMLSARYAPEPLMFEAEDDDYDDEVFEETTQPGPGGDQRVRAKITDAIRLRLRSDRARAAAASRNRREPVLSRHEPTAPEITAEPASMFVRATPRPAAPAASRMPLPAAGAPAAFAASKAAAYDQTAFVDSDDDDDDYDDYSAQEPAISGDAARFHDPKPVVRHAVKRPAVAQQTGGAAQPSHQPTHTDDDGYETPPLSLLADPSIVERLHLSDEALEENARMLENVLDDYGVKGDIVSVRPGPVVTMYELEPAPGLKASRVIGLADDIARSMSALSARVSTVPGRSVIGIELPNEKREMVLLREILAARDFGDSKMRLPLALGKDIGGEAIVANLAKMPHLLIAGTTGSGKSVAINTMILSLLYKLTPAECRLIMIDPKMLELSVYDDIPHLLSPVVTDPKKAVVALKWVVAEMEDRYRKMSKMGVRNIEGYNGKVRATLDKGEMFSRTVQTGFDDETGDPVFETEEFAPETLPYIVVIVDEMADLMMVAGKEIEACIQRLAQMARASGIHLIMATQRPSVDVITGTIKANFPTRISFQVTSKIDSRTILGEQGAEQLLGMGDMLYMAGGGRITRIHAPFVSDEEVEVVVNHLKSMGSPSYVGGVADGPDDDKSDDIDLILGLGGNTGGEDALYDQAVQIVIQDRKCSTSYIQRKLAIGYNKAARLVEQMEDNGLVSPANHVGKRDVLVPEQQ